MATTTSREVRPERRVEYEYTVKLTQTEAEVLIHILSNVGGCDKYSPRIYSQSVRDSLLHEWEGNSEPQRRHFAMGAGAKTIRFLDAEV